MIDSREQIKNWPEKWFAYLIGNNDYNKGKYVDESLKYAIKNTH
jgi:hypothetical protein